MLTSRDRKILETLSLFRCMTRDQITHLFFRNLKNPITATNSVLKRLRRDNYVEANTQWHPYIYFPSPSTIKPNSQKISHYLSIVDFYIQLCEFEQPSVFQVEQRYGSDFMQPDIFMVWRNTQFFVEIQKSRYTTEIMKAKLERYVRYFKFKGWCPSLPNHTGTNFPYIWIVSKSPYHVDIHNGIRIIQTPNVESFLREHISKL